MAEVKHPVEHFKVCLGLQNKWTSFYFLHRNKASASFFTTNCIILTLCSHLDFVLNFLVKCVNK